MVSPMPPLRTWREKCSPCTAWSPPRGPLACPQDRLIGKKVFKIRGTIPAGNYMQLPKKRSRTLGLTGRFVYIQVRWVHHAHGR